MSLNMATVLLVIQLRFIQMINVKLKEKQKKLKIFACCLVPPGVINFHVARTTTTAIRLAWETPDLTVCNSFKGYQVYLSKIESYS